MLKRKRIETDFCVVGGGLSGVCAAIAAARNGIKVVLIQERPVLGGNASSEIRMWVCGSRGADNRETGILEEIMLENLYRNPTKNHYIWDSVLYEFVLRESNITLLLNCTCMDAEVSYGEYAHKRTISIKRVTGYQMTTQTFFDISAKYYADCSGDSVLAPLTGAEFKIGREGCEEYKEDTHVTKSDSLTMGMTCLIQGRETEKNIPFVMPEWGARLTSEHFEHRNLDIYKTAENFWYLELGGDRDSIHDTEEIARELIPLAFGTWNYIKNSGEIRADNWELEFLGYLPGKRESRRLMGEYILTQRDISENKLFKDTVAFGGWPLDDHFPAGFYHRGTPHTFFETPAPYCIPYRALYSVNVDNLFFAGRNISATHMALSSTRVMATCALLGQAVGTAASIAAENDLSPHDVYLEKIELLQEKLMQADCFLPVKTRGISKLCEETPVQNGDCCIKNGQDRPHRIYQNHHCGIAVPNNTQLSYQWRVPKRVGAIHLVFDSDLNRETLPGDEPERTHTTRANILLDSPQTQMPKTLCRSFRLELLTKEGTECFFETKNNRKRFYHLPVERDVFGILLTPIDNWGDTPETNIFSFDFI